MRRRMDMRARAMAIAMLTLLVASAIQACPVCYGASANSAMARGTNNAIWFLLGVIFFVQLGFVALFWTFWRRAKQIRKRRERFQLIRGMAQ